MLVMFLHCNVFSALLPSTLLVLVRMMAVSYIQYLVWVYQCKWCHCRSSWDKFYSQCNWCYNESWLFHRALSVLNDKVEVMDRDGLPANVSTLFRCCRYGSSYVSDGIMLMAAHCMMYVLAFHLIYTVYVASEDIRASKP